MGESMSKGGFMGSVRAAVVGVAALTLAACQAPLAPRDAQVRDAPVRDGTLVVELVFGRTIADGVVVSDADWQRYVDDVLARRTDGFTIVDCQGGWLDGGRVVREGCKFVVLVIDRQRLESLKDAVGEYRRRFRQESVLWMERPCPQPMCRFEGAP